MIFSLTFYLPEMHPDCLTKYGPLSEGIQVKGAVALQSIEINGINIDKNRLNKVSGQGQGQREY